jgi:hypothetical protein
MPDLARIETKAAALDINLSRKLYLPKAGPLTLLVPDNEAGGLKAALTLTKDWDRPTGDKSQGDGVVVRFRVADTANTLAAAFRQPEKAWIGFEPVQGQGIQELEIKEIGWPEEGAARVYQIYTQTRTRGYKTYFQQR